MKVYLGEGANASIGGMARVHEGLTKYLPCEIVPTIEEADVVNPHIGIWHKFPPNKPLVLSNHGLYWKDVWGDRHNKDNANCISAILQADVVTCPSYFVQRAIGRSTLVNALVVHHGIDIDEWVPANSEGYVLWNKARSDLASDPRIVNILATRLTTTQFVTTFGETASNVAVVGKLSPQEMYKYVQHAGVYLATSQESGGPCFGVLEAMSCGVPIVTLNHGGTAEVISHKENGWLANSVEELIEGIWYCLNHRQELGANARQTVIDHYQWKDVVLGYIQAYEKALSAPPVKVSVIIPCYNLGEYVGKAVQSVINQTYTDWECIVVNDASDDNSAQVLEQFKGFPNITILTNETNQHVSESRNRAIRAAQGKYILPLDADDTLEVNALELLVPELENNRNLHLVSGKLNVTNGTQTWENTWPNESPTYERQIAGYNQIPYCTMYRKRVWENMGGYRRRIRTGIEDASLWTRIFSYGYKGKLIDQAAVRYLLRQSSLGKSHNTTSEDWLSWFGWYHNPDIRPTESIYSNDPPEISVIIPVGPGHLHHIQACLDSLIAQTYPLWEAIVINDSGLPYGHYKDGFPFVTFLTNQGKGVASARNTGLKAARGSRIVFLDVDDCAQPTMLYDLLTYHDEGWVYPDWYDQSNNRGETKDWDAEQLKVQALGPITGMYWRSDLELVGGFDEAAPGWEDWDLHLNLLFHGIEGLRLPLPLFVYNKHLGERREDNFNKRKDLLEYIQSKYNLKV